MGGGLRPTLLPGRELPKATPPKHEGNHLNMNRSKPIGFRLLTLALLLLFASPQTGNCASPSLLFHAEGTAGPPLATQGEQSAFNPASLVKIGTTLWALERLGATYRFETTFIAQGRLDEASGTLEGDLRVEGGGDPDFHSENAFLVAAALNRLGIREVQGELILVGDFWIGWEGGTARRLAEPEARRAEMNRRLRRALDPKLWGAEEKRAWREMIARRGLGPETPASVWVRGRAGAAQERKPRSHDRTLLVVHRSNPLANVLRRFNVYSNNDIERLESHLGSVTEFEAFVAERSGRPREEISFTTLSGLGRNRLTPQLVVSLLGELEVESRKQGLGIAEVLPVAGCDKGTLDNYSGLSTGSPAGSVVAKTGTLTTTDGGVAALAGFATTASGRIAFCVAAPRAGGRLREARREQERWLLDLIEAQGGGRPSACPLPLPYSDTGAEVSTL